MSNNNNKKGITHNKSNLKFASTAPWMKAKTDSPSLGMSPDRATIKQALDDARWKKHEAEKAKSDEQKQKEYTLKQIQNNTKRTWRSDAADFSHLIGEMALASNPYTATSYFGGRALDGLFKNGFTPLTVVDAGFAALPWMEKWAPVVLSGVNKFNLFMISNHTGKWTLFGNKLFRLNPNTVSTNGRGIESRAIRHEGPYGPFPRADISRGAVLENYLRDLEERLGRRTSLDEISLFFDQHPDLQVILRDRYLTVGRNVDGALTSAERDINGKLVNNNRPQMHWYGDRSLVSQGVENLENIRRNLNGRATIQVNGSTVQRDGRTIPSFSLINEAVETPNNIPRSLGNSGGVANPILVNEQVPSPQPTPQPSLTSLFLRTRSPEEVRSLGRYQRSDIILPNGSVNPNIGFEDLITGAHGDFINMGGMTSSPESVFRHLIDLYRTPYKSRYLLSVIRGDNPRGRSGLFVGSHSGDLSSDSHILAHAMLQGQGEEMIPIKNMSTMGTANRLGYKNLFAKPDSWEIHPRLENFLQQHTVKKNINYGGRFKYDNTPVLELPLNLPFDVTSEANGTLIIRAKSDGKLIGRIPANEADYVLENFFNVPIRKTNAKFGINLPEAYLAPAEYAPQWTFGKDIKFPIFGGNRGAIVLKKGGKFNVNKYKK